MDKCLFELAAILLLIAGPDFRLISQAKELELLGQVLNCLFRI